jgi:hypothetical protein
MAYDEALEAVLDGMSAAEAFSCQKALTQLGAGAGAALANPVVGQVAKTALPVGAGALGTLIGGPAGTAIGSRLCTLAAGALVRPGTPGGPAAVPVNPVGVSVHPAAVPGVAPSPAVAGGSAAAAQGLVLRFRPRRLIRGRWPRQIGWEPMVGAAAVYSCRRDRCMRSGRASSPTIPTSRSTDC